MNPFLQLFFIPALIGTIGYFLYKAMPTYGTPSLNVTLNQKEAEYILKVLELERVAISIERSPSLAENYKIILPSLIQLITKIKNLKESSPQAVEISLNLLESSIIISAFYNELESSGGDDAFDEEEVALHLDLSTKLAVKAAIAFQCEIEDLDLYERD